ncbi:uncharacterized protein LOC132169366 [Corylus avellana]|uniref:uncharacterized protein LOC132169366 n=1 Tax=Corylus avellana TaxID=13451 RepID=UPI00286C10D6|nr:uncharacterized protein LOC132169366 [Corylus avellana]
MSFFTTPRKSPRKHGMQTPSPPEVPILLANVKWEQEHEDILVHILCNCQDDGVRHPFGKHMPNITKKLNRRLKDGTAYTQKQVGDKIKHLWELWVYFSEFVRDKAGTGCGWDDDLGIVTGTPKQWEHIRLTTSLKKYYKFRNGPPTNFKHICYIFEGSTSTGKWRYASTQSPPGSDCEENDIDLNNPAAIIDLTEPHCASSHKARRKGKGKLKREGSHLQGSNSSKRSSKGEQIYSELRSEPVDMYAAGPSNGNIGNARHWADNIDELLDSDAFDTDDEDECNFEAKALCRLGKTIICPAAMELPHPYVARNGRYYLWFAKCIGAIDGTHVKACVQGENIVPYRSRKSTITQNVMCVVDFDLCFTYVYAGWEGNTHDSLIFQECIEDPIALFPMPVEDYFYLVDSAYGCYKGFLPPHRNERYHL